MFHRHQPWLHLWELRTTDKFTCHPACCTQTHSQHVTVILVNKQMLEILYEYLLSNRTFWGSW